jgi:hypothetical protein
MKRSMQREREREREREQMMPFFSSRATVSSVDATTAVVGWVESSRST